MSRGRKRRSGRLINGVVILDKPKGLSSNEALQQVKWFYKAAKAGHTGALDPLATGLLPICFGEATKFSQFLLDSDKTYHVIAQLGIKTETGDAEGAVVQQRPIPEVEQDALLGLVAEFEGEGEQVPSMYSALKHNGEPLYKLARQGIEVERPARAITIYHIELLERTQDTLTLEIKCSKGTYIRTLVEDLGEKIGCGAHVLELRRTQAGPYEAAQMLSMEQLESSSDKAFAERADVKAQFPDQFPADPKAKQSSGAKKPQGVKTELSSEVKAGLDKSWRHLDQLMLSMDSAVSQLPGVNLSENAAYYVQQGQAVQVSDAPESGFLKLCVLNDQGHTQFIGVGEINDDGLVAPSRLIVT